jgi:transposase
MTKYPVEVITSVERRRRWSRADKEQLVAACLEPGAVVSEIARCAGLHVSQLFRWRKELCRVDIRGPETAATPPLVPVRVAEALPAPPTCTAPPVSRPRRKTSAVVIDLGGGRRVRVESDIDAEALGRILDVVLERR